MCCGCQKKAREHVAESDSGGMMCRKEEGIGGGIATYRQE